MRGSHGTCPTTLNAAAATSLTFAIDTLGPALTLTVPFANNSFVVSTSIDLVVTLPSALDSFLCSLDQEPLHVCQSPLSLQGLSEGQHRLAFVGRDIILNLFHTPIVFLWQIDSTPPTTAVTSALVISGLGEASVSFEGDDGAGAGVAMFQCRLGQSPFVTCASPLRLTAAPHQPPERRQPA